MKKKFIFFFLLSLLMATGTGCFKSENVLKVGTNPTYPPFEYIDENENFAGFDIELIQLVADELGMELELTDISWDGIIPGLINGNYDCLISAMTITEDRLKQIDFSDAYFVIKQAIVVKEDNTTINSVEDLVGKTIAVQNGTTGDLFASEIKDVTMKRFDNNPIAVQDLTNNNSDACVMDDLVAYDTIKNVSGLRIIEISDTIEEHYGIGIRKGNDAMLDKINGALTALKENGKLEELISSYKNR